MTKKNTSSVVSVPVNAESKDRHRVMSNERIKYLYSRNGNTIHDKHCVCTKDILDKNLMWSE